MAEKISEGIFKFDEKIGTKNLVKSQKVYGEKLVKEKNKEYRIWNPYRSKMAAAIINGLKNIPFSPNTTVLYLGASTGTTVSHLSDIIGENGLIYCLEFSPRVFSSLVVLCESRKNMIPILADANRPQDYLFLVQKVDVLYQDIAQTEQAKIFIKNSDLFLKDDGIGILAIKARSIDVTKNPEKVFMSEKKILTSNGLKIIEQVKLDPYEKDHAFFVLKK